MDLRRTCENLYSVHSVGFTALLWYVQGTMLRTQQWTPEQKTITWWRNRHPVPGGAKWPEAKGRVMLVSGKEALRALRVEEAKPWEFLSFLSHPPKVWSSSHWIFYLPETKGHQLGALLSICIDSLLTVVMLSRPDQSLFHSDGKLVGSFSLSPNCFTGRNTIDKLTVPAGNVAKGIYKWLPCNCPQWLHLIR